jgi:hypothetical protein
MVPSSSSIFNRLGVAGSAFRVSGIHDLAEYAIPHELLDAGSSMVSSLLFMGYFHLDFMVEVSSVY